MTHTHDEPPSYDYAVTSEVAGPGPYVPNGQTDAKDVKVAPLQEPTPEVGPAAGPSLSESGPRMPPTTVYNYVNPTSGELVSSLLPPDHPQMVCLQQGHLPHTRYGLLGVLAAVFWFPLGIGLCLLDRRVKCDRCGLLIDDGLGCTL
ncbi:hypothetical protein PsYK624_116720 [Phanerochaete sordida]|uniref:Brain protein I3 n=1 Tax=Phanerochaete sordida TaxID=48140 RepID=A0A9P3LIS7_9APHY|nr:hypothetical protein PsYK624_116720 [Phanerochaete sordida]